MVMGVPDDVAALTAGERDATDPLRGFRDRFVPMDPDVIYLVGHSVGRPATATRAALDAVVEVWAARGAAGWHEEWVDLPWRVGDVIASGVLRAEPGEVIVSDSTSVNLYKLAAAALNAVRHRRVIVADAAEFPSDAYVLQGLARAHDSELRLIKSDVDGGPTVQQVREACAGRADLVVLSHVSYRSGALADMAGITEAAHDAGALVLWDLSHSAGVVPVPLRDTGADLAVGCTYKYLNSGPGAPAFLYVRQDLQSELSQPIWGWFGHADQFAMYPDFEPATDIARYTAGTPQVLGCHAVAEGARLVAEAGIERIHDKAQALTAYAVDLAEVWLGRYGVRLASPRQRWRRGAHVTLYHPAAWQLVQELADVGVMCDYRHPGRIRFGLAPLYTSFTDVYEALSRLRGVLEGHRTTGQAG
ncbi:MAG TPA: kynureninase [Micromonosporaceae bacterium]